MVSVSTIMMIVALMTFVGMIVVGVLVRNYHKEVNGRMTKLLEKTEALGRALGRAEEKSEHEKDNP